MSVTAVPNVSAQVPNVIRAVIIAFVRAVADEAEETGTAKVALTSPTAWARNKTDTKTEKIRFCPVPRGKIPGYFSQSAQFSQ